MLCTKCVRSHSRLLLISPTSRSFATAQLLRDDAPRPPALPVSLEPAPHRSSVAADGKPRVRSGTPAGTVLKNINFMKNRSDPIAKEDSEYPEWLWSMLENKTSAGGDSAAVGDAYSKSKKQRDLARKRAESVARMEARNKDVRIPPHQQSIDLPFATVPDPTAPSTIVRPTGEPFVRVVSPIGGLSDKIPAAPGARGSKPAMVEIGKDLHVTPLEAQAARLEIRTGLRKAQRKGIREKNFLSTLKA
ncbi:mitochondrial ribosomal protein L37-domain-containing protein [Tuber borchii]|uniref:Large ribosomal subunit protein mL54 n=1 Tax=Tuber borchii TaxID=42251 RepID=A0A2T7A5B4_TUBBO|nr:mitochondrial ribosomal protein L37-domain-containing protein [Tuber borchii]